MSAKRLLPLCLLAVSVLSTADLRAQQLVPFNGTWVGETIAADLTNFPVVGVVAAGGGPIAGLGLSTMVSPHTSNVFTGETLGDQIFTAANGDTLTAYCEGTPEVLDEGAMVIGGLQCSFTSGTGRFEGATGSYEFFFTATRLTDGRLGYSTVATITGSISPVGSNK
jgi:hypothetical protein